MELNLVVHTCIATSYDGNCMLYVCAYRIASNYGLYIYFFPVIFNQAAKQDRCLLLKEHVLL